MALRSVSWKTVYERAVNLCGMVPDQVSVEDFAYLKEVIDQRTQWAWESFWWPELMRVQERYYRDAFDAATTYAEGAEVYWSTTDAYHRRLSAGNTTTPADTAVWEQLTEIDAYIALEQTGKTAIGEVKRVCRRNPRIYPNPEELPFELNENGVQLVDEAPVSVWVEFRIPPERYLGEDFAEATTYAGGERVYSPDLGDFFDILGTGLGSTLDLEDSADATRVLFPRIFESFVARAAYADWLRNDGQITKANIEAERATSFLDREIDKLAGQQKQTQRYRVRGAGARH